MDQLEGIRRTSHTLYITGLDWRLPIPTTLGLSNSTCPGSFSSTERTYLTILTSFTEQCFRSLQIWCPRKGHYRCLFCRTKATVSCGPVMGVLKSRETLR